VKRVVITGLGINCSLGVGLEQVTQSLATGTSGINFAEEYKERGFRSHVHGDVDVNFAELIDRKQLRFMGDAAAYSYLAMRDAIEDSGLDESEVSNPRTGLIVGSGGASTENTVIAADTLREKGVRRVGPYMVTRTMSSTCSACLGTGFKIKGMSYSISSACATSAHCIGNAMELIQLGKQDVVTPAIASRAYDAARDGFVIAGGGGMVVVEELEHAKARGAKIYGEVVGYGATGDGADMVQPSGEGATRCMQMALENVHDKVDYINAHGTSTPVGDVKELGAMRATFGDDIPPISSTKSLSGHSLGAAGVHEGIYSLIMMRDDFICASANVDELDDEAKDFPIVTEKRENAGLNTVLSNSFGFGGTNSTLVFSRYAG